MKNVLLVSIITIGISVRGYCYDPNSEVVCEIRSKVFNPNVNQQATFSKETTNLFVDPQVIEKMLRDLKESNDYDRIIKELGEQNMSVLQSYSTLDKKQIYMNAYLAAAAGGAAVAVVDYVWDKYVGKGKLEPRLTPDDYFDLSQPGVDMPITFPDGPPIYTVPKVHGMIPHPEFAGPKINPIALTPAIGAAVGGAVAYKAVGHALRTVFGDAKKFEQKFDPKMFDLNQGNQLIR